MTMIAYGQARLQRIRQALNVPLLFSGSALIVGDLAASSTGSLYWLAAARLFSIEDVGLGSALISAMTLVAALSQCGLNHAAARFLPAAGAQRARLAQRIQLGAAGLGLMGGFIFWAGSPLWSPPVAQMGALFAVAVALYTVFTVQDQVLLGLGRAGWVPIKNGAFGVVKLGLLAAAAVWAGSPAWWAVAWPWFVTLAIAVGAALCASGRPAGAAEAAEAPIPGPVQLGRFALANHLGSVLFQLPSHAFPILVLQALGAKAVACFYMSWMIAGVLTLVSSSVASAMVAEAARPGADVRRLLLTGLRYTLALVLPGVILCVALGRPILAVFGAGYQEGYPLLVVLALGCLVNPVNAFYAGLMRIRCRLRPLLVQGLVGGGVSLGLAWPLATHLGLTGFGVAFVAGQCAAALLVLARFVARRAGGSAQAAAPGI